MDVITKQLCAGISVNVETKTLADMESWAYYTERALFDSYFNAVIAYEQNDINNLILYTEDELKDIIVNAGLIINLVDRNDINCFWTGYNTYETCVSIIEKCVTFIKILHGNYNILQSIKNSININQDGLIIEFAYQLNKLDIIKQQIKTLLYTESEIYEIINCVTYIIDILNRNDSDDIINKCNELLDIDGILDKRSIFYDCIEIIKMINIMLHKYNSEYNDKFIKKINIMLDIYKRMEYQVVINNVRTC